MPLKLPHAGRVPMLSALALLLASCGHTPQALPPVPAPAIPPLPSTAQQPEVPEWCLPTCSEGLRRMLESLLPKPTSEGPPGQSAPGDTGL